MPFIAASVSTRVVSWNDAADRNESVASDALVMPSSTRLATAGRPTFHYRRVVLVLEPEHVHQLAGQQLGIARVLYAHLAHHLAHYDLNVLIHDVNALSAVYRLHILDQVVLHRLAAQYAQQVMRIDGAVYQLVAGLYVLALDDLELGAVVDRIGLDLAVLGR